MRAPLRWEKQNFHGEAWFAYRGNIIVGMVVRVSVGERAGLWKYELDAVSGHSSKRYGFVKTESAAKKATERSWDAWCVTAEIMGDH